MQLGGKILALTGAGSGIGRALAVALAHKGALLSLADIDESAVAETASQVAANGSDVLATALDVADEAAVGSFAAETLHRFGTVDGIINNAGVGLYGTVAELTTAEIAWLMGVNF